MPDKRIFCVLMLGEAMINFAAGITVFVISVYSAIDLTVISSAVSAFFLRRTISIIGTCRRLNESTGVREGDSDVRFGIRGPLKMPAKAKTEIEPAGDLGYVDEGQKYEYRVTVGDRTVKCYSDTFYFGEAGADKLIKELERCGRVSVSGKNALISVKAICRTEEQK